MQNATLPPFVPGPDLGPCNRQRLLLGIGCGISLKADEGLSQDQRGAVIGKRMLFIVAPIDIGGSPDVSYTCKDRMSLVFFDNFSTSRFAMPTAVMSMKGSTQQLP